MLFVVRCGLRFLVCKWCVISRIWCVVFLMFCVLNGFDYGMVFGWENFDWWVGDDCCGKGCGVFVGIV